MFQNLLLVYGMARMSVRFPGLKFCPSPPLYISIHIYLFKSIGSGGGGGGHSSFWRMEKTQFLSLLEVDCCFCLILFIKQLFIKLYIV